MSYLSCERCGVPVDVYGWCVDCKEVEATPNGSLREHILDLYRYNGMTRAGIARHLGVRRWVVYETVSGRHKGGSNASETDKKQAREWLAIGIPAAEVAEELGRTVSTINYWARKFGWERFVWADSRGMVPRVEN